MRGRALRRMFRPVRNGMSPVSAVRILLGRHDRLRFRGVTVRSPNPQLTSGLALAIWGGEYDLPGFVAGPGERVVDVGANVGCFSLLAAARGARVEAYEPHPETFDYLLANTADAAVACHQAVVVGHARASGRTMLWLHPDYETHHSILPTDPVDGNALGEPLEVDAFTLTDVLDGGCDLLKIDAEGAEFELLEETPPEVLRRARRIAVEVHESVGDVGTVRALLVRAGFEVEIDRKSGQPLALLFAAQRTAVHR